MITIDKKITAVSVVTPEAVKSSSPVHSKLPARDDVLYGKTYKLKTPLSEHALYITINDVVDEAGKHKPFEIFINSKAMDNFQWIVAMTRVMSAVFRHGGDVTFLVEELRLIQDPRGGYFKKGKWMPSLIAEIGDIIEQHFISIGLTNKEPTSQHQKKLIDEAYQKMKAVNQEVTLDDGYPASATVCRKCLHRAAIQDSGCKICLHCSESSCS